MKKLRLLVLSSKEEYCVHSESLFSKNTKYLLKICQQIIQSGRFKKASVTLKKVLKNMTKWFDSVFLKHTKYLLKICQQIIQSQRFKKASITLKRVLKNVTEWFDSDQHFILTKYKLINQGMKTINDRY